MPRFRLWAILLVQLSFIDVTWSLRNDDILDDQTLSNKRLVFNPHYPNVHPNIGITQGHTIAGFIHDTFASLWKRYTDVPHASIRGSRDASSSEERAGTPTPPEAGEVKGFVFVIAGIVWVIFVMTLGAGVSGTCLLRELQRVEVEGQPLHPL